MSFLFLSAILHPVHIALPVNGLLSTKFDEPRAYIRHFYRILFRHLCSSLIIVFEILKYFQFGLWFAALPHTLDTLASYVCGTFNSFIFLSWIKYTKLYTFKVCEIFIIPWFKTYCVQIWKSKVETHYANRINCTQYATILLDCVFLYQKVKLASVILPKNQFVWI